jgi:hypothetical protein
MAIDQTGKPLIDVRSLQQGQLSLCLIEIMVSGIGNSDHDDVLLLEMGPQVGESAAIPIGRLCGATQHQAQRSPKYAGHNKPKGHDENDPVPLRLSHTVIPLLGPN